MKNGSDPLRDFCDETDFCLGTTRWSKSRLSEHSVLCNDVDHLSVSKAMKAKMTEELMKGVEAYHRSTVLKSAI